MTVFGDSVAPRGGAIWLGTLIDLLAGLDINERLVRTSVQRLVSEGVLANERVGRRSRYALTEAASLDARDAELRIYHGSERTWDGRWTMVLAIDPGSLPAGLGERLGWRGFGQLRPGVFASPVVHPDEARHLLAGLGVADQLAILSALSDSDDRSLALACFDLDAVQSGYRSFVATYAPVGDELADADPSPEVAFAVRTLLIDDYRRVLLRDPELPSALLPDDWAGATARRVAAELYRLVDVAADVHVVSVWRAGDTEVPEADDRVRSRFDHAATPGRPFIA